MPTTTTTSGTTSGTSTSSYGGSRSKKNRSFARSRSSSLAASLAGGKRKRKRRRKQRGGFSSAWNQVFDTVGSGDTQYNNTFVKGGPFHGSLQNVSGTQPSSVAMNAVLNHKGGSRKRSSRRSKKGGYWGQVLSQALVPFGLWGLQNRYSRGKKHLGNKTRKN